MRKQEVLQTLRKAESVGLWLQCLIALAWVFGKRVSELLRLRRDDFRKDDNFLYVRFLVLKKKSRRESGIPRPFMKKISLSHPAVPYILAYLKTVEAGYIFTYKGEMMSRHRPKYYLKKINPKAWWHLFRESLATEMAERGAAEEELMHWFDWDRVGTAHEYVKRGTKLTEKWSDRTW